MTDNEQSQLRFDISETVTFHNDQPGIGTLLSLDLTPEVRIEELGANVKIHGAIRLRGTYLAQAAHTEDGPAEENIQYIIPVEITLPSERAGKLEDITAEIQSFDYELLSAHELDIEALLVVDGLQLAQTDDDVMSTRFGEQEESDVFIQAQEEERNEEATPLNVAADDEEEQPVEEGWPHALDEGEIGEQPLVEEEPMSQPAEEGEDELSAVEMPEDEGEAEEQAVDDPEEEVELSQPTETNETKINFQKRDEQNEREQDEDESHVSVDALQDQGGDSEVTGEEAEEEVKEEDEEQTSDAQHSDGIMWLKERLVEEEDGFHRLKMVIAQKEDTLESIADRYDLSSVELLQLNKLESGEIQQGQILYIPKQDG